MAQPRSRLVKTAARLLLAIVLALDPQPSAAGLQEALFSSIGCRPLDGPISRILLQRDPPLVSCAPQITSEIQLSVNLDARQAAVPGGFDPADIEATSHFNVSLPIYDAAGTEHPATLHFTKTGPGQWQFAAILTLSAPSESPVLENGNTGSLTFDQAGRLVAVNGGSGPANLVFAIPTVDLSTAIGFVEVVPLATFPPIDDGLQRVSLGFGPIADVGTRVLTTQFEASSLLNANTQDGAPAGRIQCDPDWDGIREHLDNCPDTANPDQADADADGIGDVCDIGCQNGFDDDGNGLVDFPDDPGCEAASDLSEYAACPQRATLRVELTLNLDARAEPWRTQSALIPNIDRRNPPAARIAGRSECRDAQWWYRGAALWSAG